MNTKAQKTFAVNDNAIIAGIDIGKFKSVVCFSVPGGGFSKAYTINMGRNGFERLLELSHNAMEKSSCDCVVFGMEPTGHYHENLVRYLSVLGFPVLLVNPAHTKRAKELIDNSPGKTDKKDARVIADLVRRGNCFEPRMFEGTYLELKVLAQAREKLSKELTAKANYLRRLQDTVYPEFFEIIKTVASATALNILRLWPTPDALLEVGEAELGQVIRKSSRGKLGADYAARLIQAARGSVGIKGSNIALAREICYTVEDIQTLLRRIKEMEAAQKEALKQVSYAGYLLSIKGLGVVSLASLLGETGDISKYANANAIIKLAGLNLYEISSGMHKGINRITKRGRPLLRKILFLLSLRLIKEDGPIKEFYERLTARGVPAPKVLVAISRKGARIIFALVRDGRQFVKEQVPATVPVELAA